MVTDNFLKMLQLRSEILVQLRRSQSIEDFLEKGLHFINKLGFSDMDIMQVTSTAPCVNFIASSLPETFFQNYMQEEMLLYDAIPDVLVRSTTSIYRSTIYEHIFNAPYPSLKIDKNRAVNELWLSYGYNNCFYMPVDSENINGRLIISILQKNISQTEFKHKVNEQRAKLKMFHLVAEELLSQCKYLDNIRRKPASLQEGDSSILKAFCIYGTSKEVADYLGLELTTINNKITRIKKTLGASSIANAVYISLKEGFIQ